MFEGNYHPVESLLLQGGQLTFEMCPPSWKLTSSALPMVSMPLPLAA